MDFTVKKGYDEREVIYLRSLMRKIDLFCYRHPRFGIPKLMLFIVIGNAIVYVVGMMDTTQMLYGLLVFHPALFLRGEVWRLVTFALVPTTNGIIWLAISLYFYWFIGSALEQAWGAGKFTIYYFSGLILTALFSVVWYAITGQAVLLTAGYLNLSMFFAFATLWPDHRVLLFFVIPVKMKWLAWLDAALFVYEIVICLIAGNIGGALIPVVAMITYLVFCGGWLIDLLKPANVRASVQSKARTIEFKQAVRRTEKEQMSAGYSRKCAVCGRTDADDPSLEFRYCSRCAGFHCFCADHINNHVHFTE